MLKKLAAFFAAVATGTILASNANAYNPGDKLPDGTICGGENFAVSKKNTLVNSWFEAIEYCLDLVDAGHDDWTLPTNEQLLQMYLQRDAGSFSGIYNRSGKYPGSYYFSGEMIEHRESGQALNIIQSFGDEGSAYAGLEYSGSASCVRALEMK